MKTEKLIILLLLTLYSFSIYSQETQEAVVEIKGALIEEESGEPVEQATIRLLNLQDSTFIEGVTSSDKGLFSIPKVYAGTYLIHITYVGSDPLYQPLQITGKVNPVELGELALTKGSIVLDDAVITAEAPPMIIKNDTIEYNADSYRTKEGAVLEELLKKLPGVEVDKDGKIKVNGKEITKILVDGKEFFSTDPQVASKNLPADMVDKVQTYEKKSDMAELTGFDDGNEENVINLTIKPEKKRGWFGNVSAGYGERNSYEGNTMINRFVNNDQLSITGNLNKNKSKGLNNKSGIGNGIDLGEKKGFNSSDGIGANFNKEFSPKLTLNGNIYYSGSENRNSGLSRTENILSADSSLFENNINSGVGSNRSIGTGFNIDWKPDTLTTIYFRPGFSYNFNENTSKSWNNSHDQNNDPIYESSRTTNNQGEGYNTNGSLLVNRRLNSKGRSLTLSLGGNYNVMDNDGFDRSLTNYFRLDEASGKEDIDQQVNNKTKRYDFNTHISWVEPLKNNYFLQFGYGYNQSRNESLKYSYTKGADEQYSILDSAYSKSFENRYISQSLNVSFRSQRENYHYQIGMGVNPSSSKSHSFITDTTLSRVSQNVVNYSPNIFFGYRWSKGMNLNLQYFGNTQQPTISQLQPVQEITSATHTTIGNPNLKTSYMNNLGAHFYWFKPEKQQNIMVGVNGGYMINTIVTKDSYDPEGSGKKITTYENVNGNYNSSLNASFNSPFRNKKFEYNLYANISHSKNIGFINEEKSNNKSLSLYEGVRLTFRTEKVDAGINGNVNFNSSKNSLDKQNNRKTWNFNGGGYVSVNLPWDITLESNCNYMGTSGYSSGFNQNQILLNGSATKSFMKNKQALISLNVFDVLNKASNIYRSETATYIQETESENFFTMFMVRFVYRFQKFPGTGGPSPSGSAIRHMGMRMF